MSESRISHDVDYSRTEMTYIVRPSQINGYGRLFGGQLMVWFDELAGIVAVRHAGTLCTTAVVDQLVYKVPAYANDIVVLQGRLARVGRTSMEVRIDSYIEDLNGRRQEMTRAFFVMVAIDEEGNPVQVPALELKTEQERQEFQLAEIRNERRKQRQYDGY